MRGIFITIEGGEGAGKTTLSNGLAEMLNGSGHQVLLTREPGGTKLGEEVRSLLLHSKETKICDKAELLLFLAARAQHVHEKILPSLHNGIFVICDRFSDSTIAYQGIARGLGFEYVSNLCALATDNLSPDITFYINLDPELGRKRLHDRYAQASDEKEKSSDRIEKEKMDFHAKVQLAFLDLARLHPDRIIVLDGSLSKEEVLDQAKQQLLSVLKSRQKG